MSTLYTIGHSTRDLAEFSRVLQTHDIGMLVDIRAFPRSRRHPHFNREHLELWLPEIGCDYIWEKDLGGKRSEQVPPDESPHIALKEAAFRNYADYMLTPRFQQAAQRLLPLAEKVPVVLMCAERDYLNCHRSMVSDYLYSQGHTLLHIRDENPPVAHELTREARLLDGRLIYRGDYLL